MPRKIDSDALTLVGRQLGISGQAGQNTTFEEDDLIQVLNVTSAIRRARADVATGGYFFGRLRNTHAAADSEVSNIDPYLAGIFASGTYPRAVSNRFDLWLHSVTILRTIDVGELTIGSATLLLPERFQGFGKSDAASVLAASARAHVLHNWTGGIVTTGGTNEVAIDSNGDTMFQVNQRFPIGGLLQFSSDSAGAATFEMVAVFGLFPVGMGSDLAL